MYLASSLLASVPPTRPLFLQQRYTRALRAILFSASNDQTLLSSLDRFWNFLSPSSFWSTFGPKIDAPQPTINNPLWPISFFFLAGKTKYFCPGCHFGVLFLHRLFGREAISWASNSNDGAESFYCLSNRTNLNCDWTERWPIILEPLGKLRMAKLSLGMGFPKWLIFPPIFSRSRCSTCSNIADMFQFISPRTICCSFSVPGLLHQVLREVPGRVRGSPKPVNGPGQNRFDPGRHLWKWPPLFPTDGRRAKQWKQLLCHHVSRLGRRRRGKVFRRIM